MTAPSQSSTPTNLWSVAADLLEPREPKYWDDPVGWGRDILGIRYAGYQEECLEALLVHHKVSAKGPHGLGKTAVSSTAILWFAETRNRCTRHIGCDWKVVTTAGVWRQLEEFLWPEVHKWGGRMRWELLDTPKWRKDSELLTQVIKLSNGRAFAVASNDPQQIEGAHATHLLYVYDESKSISAATFDATEGAFSNAGADTSDEAFALAMSTPGAPSGRFYQIHAKARGYEDWWTRSVSLEEAIEAGRISRAWADQRALQWGVDSSVYKNRVLGQFASQDEDAVIPLAWLEMANERWVALNKSVAAGEVNLPAFSGVGVDVARSGQDKTVYARRYMNYIAELEEHTHQDIAETTNQVEAIIRLGGYAQIDIIGLGAGVYDALRERKYDVSAFNASARSDFVDQSGELGFVNRRAEAWWNLRELLDPRSGANLALPVDDELTGDLTAPKWRVMQGGRIQVESKDDIGKRIGRSTDRGDGVVMACAMRSAPAEELYLFDEPVQVSDY